jgi:hypothetical protein
MAKTGGTAGTAGSTGAGTERMVGSEPALLGIYLNDHLAGATFGVELAQRVVSAHRDSENSVTLERLAAEIAEDRTALLDMMAALNVPPQQYKVFLGWLAEKVGRLKPNGHLLERSPLSSLEELEVMRLGVEGKEACWRTLRVLADHDDRLDTGRLGELLVRARRQADTLEELRVRATAELVGVV